ncbi:MAG: hypothetical protein HYS13_08615, partial [Planctomycetia bacterium]|nr:hypothetical protein [Planctomycetia bacterium]
MHFLSKVALRGALWAGVALFGLTLPSAARADEGWLEQDGYAYFFRDEADGRHWYYSDGQYWYVWADGQWVAYAPDASMSSYDGYDYGYSSGYYGGYYDGYWPYQRYYWRGGRWWP